MPEKQSKRKRRDPHKFARDVYKLVHTTKFMIPKLCFCRLVREILQSESKTVTRMTTIAFEAIQEATEMYVTNFLEDAYRCTLHRGQVTIKPMDMVLLRSIRRDLI